MLTLIGFAFVLIVDQTATLRGNVVDESKQPIVNAIVAISAARPRTGKAIKMATAYDECNLRARTNSKGEFVLEKLSNDLIYTVTASAIGFEGERSSDLDPKGAKANSIALSKLPESADFKRIRGVATGHDGKPLFGATVEARFIQIQGQLYRSHPSVASLTLTDESGRFELLMKEEVATVTYRVSAPSHAPSDLVSTPTSNERADIQLARGASVRGELRFEGKPLTNTEVGLVQSHRGLGRIVTPLIVSSDEQGHFRFDNLPASVECVIATVLDQKALGVLPATYIQVPDSGKLADFGAIATEPPQRLTVALRTLDGSPIPDKSKIYIRRADDSKGLELTASEENSATVEVMDAAKEVLDVSVRVPGYKVIRSTPKIDPNINQVYCIPVNGPTTLTLFLSPAKEQ